MKRVLSAQYKQYNANNRGTNAPDCVKRAISLAFDLPYNQISKELNEVAKGTSRKYNQTWVYEKVIYGNGGSKYVHIDPDELGYIVLDEWIDSFGSKGTYIVETSPKPPTSLHCGNHLTCVIDGTLYDSWDSSNQYIVGYYKVEGVNREFTDIQEHMLELNDAGYILIYDLYDKYQKKYNLSGGFRITNGGGKIKQYSIAYQCFYLDVDRNKRYNVSFSVVFTPTTSYEEAKKILNNTIRTRMYDRFYAINKDLVELKEAEDLFKASGYSKREELWLSPIEGRFYNNLPAWVKPFIVYLNIENPGQYSDSYRVRIRPLPDDPNRNNLEFWGENAGMIKDEMQRYKSKLERPDDDYSVYDTYL